MYSIIDNEQKYGYDKFKAFATLFDTAPLIQNKSNEILNQLQRRFKPNVVHFKTKRELIRGKQLDPNEYAQLIKTKGGYGSKYKAAEIVHVHTDMLPPPRCALKYGEKLMPGRNKECIGKRNVKYELKLIQKAKRDAYDSLRCNQYDTEHTPARPKPPCKPNDERVLARGKYRRTRLCKTKYRMSFVRGSKAQPKLRTKGQNGRYNGLNTLIRNHRRIHSVTKSKMR